MGMGMGMGMRSNMVMALMVVLFASYGTRRSEGIIGVNWGRQSAQRLLPSQVVDLLLQNGIKHARVYSSENDILSAFEGTGIELSISIFTTSLIDSVETAKLYVNRIMPFLGPSNVRNIYFGGYVFDKAHNQSYLDSALNSLHILQNELNERRFEDGRRVGEQVKANIIHFELSMKRNISKPSEAEFVDEVKPSMMQYLEFLRENKAPFPVEFMPILDATKFNNFGLDFAFADNKSELVIEDDANGAVYTNVFEWQYDCFAWALKKLNASDMKIVVTQVGWPTDGIYGGSSANAERFFKHLLPLVASDRGTPMRPGAPIDTFVHALTDETKMVANGFARHWGIYRSNGEPKYKIDLTGQGRDVTPTTVKGIMRMPSRWCVFNGDRSDPYKVNDMVKWACANTDCSSTNAGGSCGKLTFEQNVSFVFNMFFQFQFQAEAACFFDGLGTLSVDNPSTGECVFPVEVVKGRQRNFVSRPPGGFSGSVG